MTADWIIFYSDGQSFSSLDGKPWEAQRDYVQCIAVADIGCGNYILAEQNFYCWHFEDNCWVPHDIDGLLQYLRVPGDRKVVLAGYWVKRERYTGIRAGASRDVRLPPKTAEGPRNPEGS